MTIKKFTRALAIAAAPVALLMAATPAVAGPPPPNGTDIGGCSTSLSLPTPDAIACAGYYSGNVLNGSAADILNQQNAIASLPGTFTWDGNWSALANASNPYFVLDSDSGTANPGLTSGNQLNFGQTLFGTVIIGAHWGNIPEDTPGNLGNVSVFWLFNLTTPTNFITLDNTQGWSNAALYTTDVNHPLPEPSTWAMMLFGFGAAGVAMRRSRRKAQLLSQLA
jgi:PEP-CTERM motif